MDEDYEKLYREIIKLIEQIPIKRYGEINLVLAKEVRLMLIDTQEYSSLKTGIEKALDKSEATKILKKRIAELKQIIIKLAFGREDKVCELTKEENELIKGLV